MSESTLQRRDQKDVDRLARQFMDLVYASALRQLSGDESAAQDVTQAVMLVMLMKQQAGGLPKEHYMAGWLLNVTRHAVLQLKRAEARRMRRESSVAGAARANISQEQMESDVRAALDDALLALGKVDREIVVRRYLRGESLAEAGEALALSDNSAGRRVARALAKLRKWLARRGIVVPVLLIATTMSVEASVKAPAACATVAAAGKPIVDLVKEVIWRMLMAKVKATALVGLGIALAMGGVSATVFLMRSAGAYPPSIPAAQSTPASGDFAEPGALKVVVVRSLDDPAGAILKQVLAGLKENQGKLVQIHVVGTDVGYLYDAQRQEWSQQLGAQGEAWMVSGPVRKVRAEIAHTTTLRMRRNGGIAGGRIQDASFIESWDGASRHRIYGPPISRPSAEISDQRDLQGEVLLGADFSMQLPWDLVTSANLQGTKKDVDQYPLDPAVLGRNKVSARRVVLSGTIKDEIEALELTVEVPIGNNFTIEKFWFDSRQGFALLAREDTTMIGDAEAGRTTRVIKEIAEAAPAVYYPKRAVMLQEMRGNPLVWEEFMASRVVANEPVQEAAFLAEIPQGIKVTEFVNGKGTSHIQE